MRRRLRIFFVLALALSIFASGTSAQARERVSKVSPLLPESRALDCAADAELWDPSLDPAVVDGKRWRILGGTSITAVCSRPGDMW